MHRAMLAVIVQMRMLRLISHLLLEFRILLVMEVYLSRGNVLLKINLLLTNWPNVSKKWHVLEKM